MSSPSRETVLSSSPAKPGSPVRRRSSTAYDPDAISRHSPTLVRSMDPNDPQAMERQRTMDVDMAMQLSRARRETIGSPSSPPGQEDLLSMSTRELRDIEFARGTPTEDDLKRQPSIVDFRGQIMQQGQDPALLAGPIGRPQEEPSLLFGLPSYQPSAQLSVYDFGPMEEFATAEKANLGLSSTPPQAVRFPLNLTSPRHQAPPTTLGELEEAAGPSDPAMTPRSMRQRKLSQSNPNPRVSRKGIGGKLALFEGSNGDALPLPQFGLPPPPGQSNNTSGHTSPTPPPFSSLGFPPPTPGNHGRPYRFSFYSNALSATIHARSLSELPADGQTFEELFVGSPSNVPLAANKSNRNSFSTATASRPVSPGRTDGVRTPQPFGRSSLQPRRLNAAGPGESEGNTWWLDVLNPTDEEMKLLSKVFSIHPLTTEDIQMEEIREKIELFRNYYFVCFRSFDQDQYSPTYLEPLNMYIIVFREGTLSFHFRPTSHPQNVRRRIKQLKDYISVTSDWISYALIDDITDAFGPLIQNIEYEVDSIDELVLILKEAEQGDMLLRIGRCRKKVMGLLRLMGNKADVVKGLAKRCNENWQVAPTSDIGLYLSDIQDHLITMTQNLNHYEKILSRSHSNYLAQISIEMTDANNQINDVLSKLTALGTVLIPMNLVTGLWGMNVHVPGQDVPGYKWFASIIATLAAFAVIGGWSTYKLIRRG